MTTRRRFLALSCSMAAAAFAERRVWGDVPGMTFGVQLFMVREQAATDLPGALREIHEAGFPQVELYPIAYKGRTAAEVRTIVANSGLGAVAGHFDYQGLADRVSYAEALGLHYMVCPMLPKAQWGSLDGFRRAAELFNQVGEQARSRGMEFVFHNHDYEFRPVEGSTGFAELLRHTDPALVKLELDMYWLTQAGQDPLAVLKEHAARVRLIHLKDRLANSPTSFTTDPPQHFIELGRGTIDWRAILLQARSQGIRYAFVDQDGTTLPLPESLRLNREYLRRLTA